MRNTQSPPNEAYQLLSDPETLKNARADSGIFLRRLAEHPTLLKDLLYISFRPNYFQQEAQLQLTTAMPVRATDALSTLYEDLVNLLANDRILPKERSLEGLEGPEGEEEVPVIEQPQPKEEFIYIRHIHGAFEDPQSEDASMSNLSRILGPLYYHCPEKIMQFYQKFPETRSHFFGQLWRRGVMEIFCKLMEVEVGKQFFRQYKMCYLNEYFKLALQNLEGDLRQEWLECTLQLHRFITEKMEERYDGNKFMALLETLAANNLTVLKQLLEWFPQVTDQTALVCLRLAEESLKQDSWVIGAAGVCIAVTSLNRKNSISNSFYGDEKTSNKAAYHLKLTHLAELGRLLQLSQARYVNTTGSLALILISFYRTLYFWLKVLVAGRSEGKFFQLEPLTNDLLNENFFGTTFAVIQQHPTSTPLHNYIKELIIECLKQKIISTQYFLNCQSPYAKTLFQWLPRIPSNKLQVPFGPQIYHIYTQVQKLESNCPKEIVYLLSLQKGRRQKSIGGIDSLKFHDSLRSSANNYSSSSEEILQFDIPSLHSASSQQIQLSSLKLNSPLSIEEQIVIEGAGEDSD